MVFGSDVHHKGRAEEEAFDLRQSGTGGQVIMTVCVITGMPPSQVLCYTPSDVILTCEVPREEMTLPPGSVGQTFPSVQRLPWPGTLSIF